MLTDLSFLTPGSQFPPKSERERLQLYDRNRKLFENGHSEVYREAFKRIARVIGNFDQVIQYEVIANYQKLLTLKIVDLLLGEPPTVVAGKTESPQQKTVEEILRITDLHNKSNVVGIDVSRYGDGLFYVYKDAVNGGMIGVTQPPLWFPVTDPMNVTLVNYHVLAWVVEGGTEQSKTYTLHVQIHERGKFEKRTYSLEKAIGGYYTIINQLSAGIFENTFLDDFAIIPVPNVLTSDRIHGMDDYTDIDSIVSELLVRVSQISKILDKFAEPGVSGPSSALDYDPATGEWKLKIANYFPRDSKEDAPVEMIVWDASLDANFKQIELLINLLHAISESGGQLLGDTNQEGGALSGTALRFKLVSPLAKARRIALRFRPALEKAIRLCSQLGGKNIVSLKDVPISIKFNDGLPNDPKEEAEIIALRTANAKTMSTKRVLMSYDGMSEEDAENEIEAIDEDETKANPLRNAETPFNGGNEPPNNEPPGGEEE